MIFKIGHKVNEVHGRLKCLHKLRHAWQGERMCATTEHVAPQREDPRGCALLLPLERRLDAVPIERGDARMHGPGTASPPLIGLHFHVPGILFDLGKVARA